MSSVTASNVTVEPLPPELDEIFDEYYTLLYRTAFGVTGREEDAEGKFMSMSFRCLSPAAEDAEAASQPRPLGLLPRRREPKEWRE